ncbi:TPA: hypothetical protein QEG37_004907 [Pluralibacter gergoviae]|nr:hypothetical protein [Pluralibacter gergoviae]HDS1244314.1 hypothetical protein [Pluralibacter gergoviae]HDS1249757.1 hypothetical protein [Pluralibacter gergoviae]HDS1255183.1 hypothetical protein [Pluralibacter gergoviae]HDS1260796.1 hypothetical protein [Pluralibacter gergoviae]
MSSPLFGAGYLRAPKKSGTKAEVLAMLRKHVMEGMPGDGKNGEQRRQDKLDELHALVVHRRNERAGPVFQIVGPTQPWSSRGDERFKDYIGRGGNTRND